MNIRPLFLLLLSLLFVLPQTATAQNRRSRESNIPVQNPTAVQNPLVKKPALEVPAMQAPAFRRPERPARERIVLTDASGAQIIIKNQQFESSEFIGTTGILATYTDDLLVKIAGIQRLIRDPREKTRYATLISELKAYSAGINTNIVAKTNVAHAPISYREAELALYNLMASRLQTAVDAYNGISTVSQDIIEGMEDVVSISSNYLQVFAKITDMPAPHPPRPQHFTVDRVIKRGFPTLSLNIGKDTHVFDKPDVYRVDRRTKIEIVSIPYPSADYRPVAMQPPVQVGPAKNGGSNDTRRIVNGILSILEATSRRP